MVHGIVPSLLVLERAKLASFAKKKVFHSEIHMYKYLPTQMPKAWK